MHISKVLPIIGTLVVFLSVSGILATTALADERPITADANWVFIVGGARAWPALSAVNHDIRLVQRQLRASGANVGTLPTWDKTLTGTLGLGIQRRLPVLDGRLWAGYFFSYGPGHIKSSNGLLATPSGLALPNHFEQVPIFYGNSLYLSCDVLRFQRVVFSLAGSVGLNILSSEMEVALSRPVMASRTKSTFGAVVAPAAGVQLAIDYLFTSHVGLSLTGRYDWCVFTGKRQATTTTVTTTGIMQRHQAKDIVVDTSGPSIGLYIKFFL